MKGNMEGHVRLDYTSYSEVEDHIKDVITSSVAELKTRRKHSMGDMMFPLCGVGWMVKYSLAFTPLYDAKLPGIECHIEFACMKIVDSILSDIKLISRLE